MAIPLITKLPSATNLPSVTQQQAAFRYLPAPERTPVIRFTIASQIIPSA
jgi:hypothetical protein